MTAESPHSAFTPFARRFTDERARDTQDTEELYRRVERQHRQSPYADPRSRITLGADIYAEFSADVPEYLTGVFARVTDGVLALETPIFDMPQPNLRHLSLAESVDLRRFLRSKEWFYAHEDRVIDDLRGGMTLIFSHIASLLPVTGEHSPFSIPLIDTIPEPRELLDRLIGTLWEQRYIESGIFVELSRQIYFNICRVSEIVDPHEPKRPFRLPTKHDGPLDELVHAYFGGTPFDDFLLAPVPLRFSYEDRFSHMHVVGGSGAGKTTLLRNLIQHDLAAADPPALVIVDSQGDLIPKLAHLAQFAPAGGRLSDRFLYITPKDIDHPPALNLFDLNRTRLAGYEAVAKEQVIAGVIQTFDYLFAGLLGADLTAKQGVFFRYIARLMLALPETMGRNATIFDMIDLMDDPAPYRDAIASLPPIQRHFFERDFQSKTFTQTKEQIRYRLQAILENPTIARLFTSPHTKIDLFTELNRGSIILVDTAKDFLKGASSHFGRIFISLVLQAVLERAAIPEAERKPAFLIVDEAASYFDTNIDDLLTEARKYKLGCVFAHQFLDQATSSLRASLAANTAIKMAGGVSTADARALAPDLRTTADFILTQPRHHFASFIRNVTPSAVSIPVQRDAAEEGESLADDEYEELLELNRGRVSLDGTEESSTAPPDESPPIGEPAASTKTSASASSAPATDSPKASAPKPKAAKSPDSGTDAATEW